mmetsp:Transcript_24820/g.35013  ORF Transcript_24820/g.35013 Transcript_24820/m.35013 type:complete len:298 (-) Transcript_24820:372-1265(-)
MMPLRPILPLLALLVNVVVGQPGYFDVCHICPGGDKGFRGGGNVLNTGLSSYSCNEAQQYGFKRELGDASCLIFQMYANRPQGGCECNTPVTFPVENTNPECQICRDFNGIYPGTDNIYTNTIMGQMTCAEVFFNGINKFIPAGYCESFQNYARDKCCTADFSNLSPPPPLQAPPAPTPVPSPEATCSKGLLSHEGCSADPNICCDDYFCQEGTCVTRCQKGRDFDSGCGSDGECCSGYKCVHGECKVASPPATLRTRTRAFDMSDQAWNNNGGNRGLLRKVADKVTDILTAESGGY